MTSYPKTTTATGEFSYREYLILLQRFILQSHHTHKIRIGNFFLAFCPFSHLYYPHSALFIFIFPPPCLPQSHPSLFISQFSALFLGLSLSLPTCRTSSDSPITRTSPHPKRTRPVEPANRLGLGDLELGRKCHHRRPFSFFFFFPSTNPPLLSSFYSYLLVIFYCLPLPTLTP